MPDTIVYHPERRTGGTPELTLVQCGWMACAPGHFYGPAVRDHMLIHYIARGCGRFEKQGQSFHLGPGQCFAIYPGETTRYAADDTDPWAYYWAGFEGPLAERLLAGAALSPQNPVFHMGEAAQNVIRCVKQMYAGTQLPPGGPVKALGLLVQFLSYIVDSCPKTRQDPLTPAQREYLTRAIYHIQEQYTREINVRRLAAHVGIDRSYLYRIFKETYGVGPGQYVIALRVAECRRLLRETTLPVGRIAMETGFASPSHMGKEFKKAMGISPLAYRRGDGKV